jgi:hypothetical protein
MAEDGSMPVSATHVGMRAATLALAPPAHLVHCAARAMPSHRRRSPWQRSDGYAHCRPIEIDELRRVA